MTTEKRLLITAITGGCLVAGALAFAAAAGAAATPVAGTATAAATQPALTPTPQPTATEEIPPTPGPPTATPQLPEEGGPPGGVLSGHIYTDEDGSKSYTRGDTTIGGTIIVDRVDSDGNLHASEYAVATDVTGAWQVRALPDGRYRVRWDPQLPKAEWPLTIPPVETIVLNPIETIHEITRTVEVRDANRIAGIDFGIPKRPLPQQGIELPRTGGRSGGSPWLPAGLSALALGIALAGAAWLTARGGRRIR